MTPGSEPELGAEVDVCSRVAAAAAVAESWQSRTPYGGVGRRVVAVLSRQVAERVPDFLGYVRGVEGVTVLGPML